MKFYVMQYSLNWLSTNVTISLTCNAIRHYPLAIPELHIHQLLILVQKFLHHKHLLPTAFANDEFGFLTFLRGSNPDQTKLYSHQ